MTEKTVASEIEEIKALYPEARDGCPQATDEDLDAWKGLRYAMQERDRWEEKANRFKLRLMHSLRECDTLVDGDTVLVTWKSQSRSDIDRKRFKADHPDLYQKYETKQTCRVFRMKGQKNGQ
jgi:predicted phage-related endonuclease